MYGQASLGITNSIACLGIRRPDFFKKTKEKELYSNRNSFYLWFAIAILRLPDFPCCDQMRRLLAYRSCLRLDQTQHSSQAGISQLFRSLLLPNTDCESHQTGGLRALHIQQKHRPVFLGTDV